MYKSELNLNERKACIYKNRKSVKCDREGRCALHEGTRNTDRSQRTAGAN